MSRSNFVFYESKKGGNSVKHYFNIDGLQDLDKKNKILTGLKDREAVIESDDSFNLRAPDTSYCSPQPRVSGQALHSLFGALKLNEEGDMEVD